jgi:hypothetical protein
MKILKQHWFWALVAGMYFAVTGLTLLHGNKTVGLIMLAAIWVGGIVRWEWMQQMYSGLTMKEYLRLNWKHVLVDLAWGLFPFLFIFIPLAFGDYIGSTLRP